MGPLHRCTAAPTPPGEPLPERTLLTERAEGKQEVDEKKPQHSREADFTDCFPTGLGFLVRGLVFSYLMIPALAACALN